MIPPLPAPCAEAFALLRTAICPTTEEARQLEQWLREEWKAGRRRTILELQRLARRKRPERVWLLLSERARRGDGLAGKVLALPRIEVVAGLTEGVPAFAPATARAAKPDEQRPGEALDYAGFVLELRWTPKERQEALAILRRDAPACRQTAGWGGALSWLRKKTPADLALALDLFRPELLRIIDAGVKRGSSFFGYLDRMVRLSAERKFGPSAGGT